MQNKIYILFIIYFFNILESINNEERPNVYKLTVSTDQDYISPSSLTLTKIPTNIETKIIDWSSYLSQKFFNTIYNKHVQDDKNHLNQTEKMKIFGDSDFLSKIILQNIKNNNQVKNIFATGGINYDYLIERNSQYMPIKNSLTRYSKKEYQLYYEWEEEFKKTENKIKENKIIDLKNFDKKITEQDIKFKEIGFFQEKLRNIFIFIKEKKLDNNAIFLSKSQKYYEIDYLIDNLVKRKKWFEKSSYDKTKKDQAIISMLNINELAINDINEENNIKNKNKYFNIFYSFFLINKIDKYIKNPNLISVLYDTKKNFKDRMIFNFKEEFNQTKKELELDVNKLISILNKINYVENAEDIKKHNTNKNLTKIFNYQNVPKIIKPQKISPLEAEDSPLDLLENLESYKAHFSEEQNPINKNYLKKELKDKIYRKIQDDMHEENADNNLFI